MSNESIPVTERPKRQPWSRRHALTLFDKIGVEHPARAYRTLRGRWASEAQIPSELKVHLVLAGAIGEWLEDLSQLQLIRCVERQRRFGENCEIEKVSSSTLPILATDIGAIISLCRVGYDVQARSLLRNFIEKIDLLICIRLSQDFSKKYLAAGSFEESRDFFYRNVSGGKLAKKALVLFKESYPSADFIYECLMGEWRATTSLMLGAAVHGNHTVSMMSLFPNLGRGRSDAIGLRGHPTNGSNATLQKMMYACMPLHFLFSSIPYEETSSYLEQAGLDVADMEYYKRFYGLLLTFPLVIHGSKT